MRCVCEDNNSLLKNTGSYVYVGVKGTKTLSHDEVIKWKHFRRFWPFVCLGGGGGGKPVTGGFPSQMPVTLNVDVFCGMRWTNGWANNRDAGDFRRHGAHYDVTVIRTRRRRSRSTLTEVKAYKLAASHYTYMPRCVFVGRSSATIMVIMLNGVNQHSKSIKSSFTGSKFYGIYFIHSSIGLKRSLVLLWCNWIVIWFPPSRVNIMAADDLAPCVARSSAVLMLTM